MKGNGHDSVSEEEGLFNAISMMYININVQCSRLEFQKFKNGKNYIIGIAKTGGFTLFSMMKATAPIDTNIGLIVHEQIGGIDGTTTTELAKLVKTCKTGAIACFIDIKLGFLLGAVDFVSSFLL